jgi:hypothetical protein
MSRSNSLALDTVHFLNQRTTDSDPFGDRDKVRSSVHVQQRLQEPHQFGVAMRNETLRDEARQILDESARSVEKPAPSGVASDCQLLTSIKREILTGNPANLINVLIFWINLQVSRGMPNHNQCVFNVLQDMKNAFVAKYAPQVGVVQALNEILCAIVKNLNNDDYDSTESIVDFIEIVGVYYMREFLVQRHVILEDPEAIDVLSVWISFQYIFKRQSPAGIGAYDASKQLLDCMKAFEEHVDVPVV